MGAPVTWFEINTADAEGVGAFYAQVFDWQLESMGQADYSIVSTGDDGAIGGGIGGAQRANQVTFYIEVDDPQAYLDRIAAAGGQTVMPVTEVPGPMPITFAQFSDPQGNVIGLVKRQS